MADFLATNPIPNQASLCKSPLKSRSIFKSGTEPTFDGNTWKCIYPHFFLLLVLEPGKPRLGNTEFLVQVPVAILNEISNSGMQFTEEDVP
jgi:hypothetical protein